MKVSATNWGGQEIVTVKAMGLCNIQNIPRVDWRHYLFDIVAGICTFMNVLSMNIQGFRGILVCDHRVVTANCVVL